MPLFGLFGPPNVEQLKAKRDVAGLIKALSYQKNANVRKTAACALGQLEDRHAAEPLVAALNDGDKWVREAALAALSKLGDGAVGPLIVALNVERGWVQEAAAEALGKLGDGRAVEPLIAVLKDWDDHVRNAAMAALSKLGDGAVEPLIVALNDGESRVREAAVIVLGRLGNGRAAEPLIAALKDKEYQVRKEAASALGELGDERAVEPLIAALKDQDDDVRKTAASALWKFGDARAVEPLIATLKDEDSLVRMWAARALVKFGDERAVEPLIAALKDEDRWVREAAVAALEKLGDGRAVEPLLTLFEGDQDEKVRERAIGALKNIDDKLPTESIAVPNVKTWKATGQIHKLIQALEHPDKKIREEAVFSLRENVGRRDIDAVQPLLKYLDSGDTLGIMDAIWALGVIADSRAVEKLVSLAAQHSDDDTKYWVVWALGQIDDPRTTEPTQKATSSTDDAISKLASSILSYKTAPLSSRITLYAFLLKAPPSQTAGSGLFGMTLVVPPSQQELEDKIRKDVNSPNAKVVIIRPRDWDPPQIESMSQQNIQSNFPMMLDCVEKCMNHLGLPEVTQTELVRDGTMMINAVSGQAYFIYKLKG